MILVNESKHIIFGVSEKCNSVGIAKMFLEYIGELDKALRFHSWIHKYIYLVYIRNHPYPTQKNICTYFKLKFVRCPYDRAVSIFIHCVRHRLIPDISFQQFLESLTFYCRNRAVASHSKIQFDDKSWDRIVHIESLQEEISTIERENGILLNSHHVSSHWISKGQTYSPLHTSFIGSKTYDKTVQQFPYPCFYNSEIKKYVEKIYKKDIQTFGYSYEDFLARWSKP